ncbi:endonuclease MutS2 [Paenibacillus humicola]|uniref:endonuclease MutS2 n=1 Tax=Paenibacillus humicola TaxID=3110540 RepID=UPI00237A09E0|nr:DNA mismatch repair protein MutS [Paenibacillus humicola]
MNEASFIKLEYDKIKKRLVEYTVSDAGRTLAERHRPSGDERPVRAWLRETGEAAQLLATGASVPLSAMEGIEPFIALLGKGKMYTEEELGRLASWLAAVAHMKRYMDAKRDTAPTISEYADSMSDCPSLREELDRCIRYGELTDQASPELGDIRRHLAAAEDRIEKRLQQLTAKYKSALQEQIVSKRAGHFVLPVKRDLRRQVPGTVWDESASGQTLFVEPADVAGLQAEWQMWKAEEDRERTIVLSRLSEMAEAEGERLKWNLEAMAAFDFIFARAKLSRSYDGIAPELLDRPYIRLVGARHPLLGEGCVPLDVEIGGSRLQLIVTGPNTGGKTVALKTIGLLALMAQSGLLVPAAPGTAFGLFRHIMADVGDGQSIEQSLSTFSAHMASMREILDSADSRTLVLLDELAAGTDPGEGIALSIAILEELLNRGSVAAATTHFNEIKRYAAQTEGCTNARMAFDAETLMPLYRLEIGEAGESYAFAIARRFGLPERVVAQAEARIARVGQSRQEPSVPAAGVRKELRPREAEFVAPDTQSSARRDGAGEQATENPHSAAQPERTKHFQVGDCVWIHPLKRTGIVYRPADERGEVVVQIQGQKRRFNRKRLSLYIEAAKLYPSQDYDMDIVFDTKANRKTRKLMGRKYVTGLQIETPNPDEPDR